MPQDGAGFWFVTKAHPSVHIEICVGGCNAGDGPKDNQNRTGVDEFASVLEHGWSVHTENLWSFLDITFVLIYLSYFIIRMRGLAIHDGPTGKQALDVLALAAPVLLPRLAFCLMSESMLIISLRAMMSRFFVLSALAAWLFGGFLLAMRWLSESQTGLVTYTPIQIAGW